MGLTGSRDGWKHQEPCFTQGWGGACAHPRVPLSPPSPHGQEIRCSEERWCLVGLQVNFYSTFSMEREATGALSKPSAARAERRWQPRLRGSGHGMYRSISVSCPRGCGLPRAPVHCAAGSPVAEGCLAADPVLTKGWPGAGWASLQPAGCCKSDSAREAFPCFNGELVLPLLYPILTEGSWTSWPGKGYMRRCSGSSVGF